MSIKYSYYYGCGYNPCVGYDYSYPSSCYSPNVAPVANNDCFSGCEDQPVIISSANLLSNDTDKNSDKLTITSVQGALNGTVSLVNGQVTFTPIANYNGPASFTYTVSDGHGGTSTATVNLSISPVNDRPDAVNDSITVATSGPVTIDPATLLANDKDVDGDKLTITSVQCATNGTVALVNGKIIFTPNAGYSGPATFTYTISDGKGGCGDASSDTATVCLTIPKANVAPDAVNDGAITGNEDTAFVINMATLLANDTDANGDKLTITSVQAAVHGAVAIVSGQVIFTPDANYSGPASFTYTLSDGKGGVDTATVSLNICAVNDAPDAVNDSFVATNTAPMLIALTALLANDKDVEGDSLSVTSVQDATNGTVAIVGGNVVFTPAAGFSGTATFTYTTSDAKGGFDTATVSVYVPAHIVDAINDGVIELSQNTPVNILASTLIANDTDSEGDALHVVSVQDAQNGTVSLVNGVITFVPNAGYNGPATFTYTVSDGTAAADAINISLNFDSLAQGQDIALVDGWSTSNIGGKVEVRSGSVYGTNSTSNVIELERNAGDAGNLIKEFSAAKGQLVTLSFDYAARSGSSAGSDSAVQVIINGSVVQTINTHSTSFSKQTVQFEADGGLVRLEFKALDSNSYGGLLDNILITAPAIVGSQGLTDTATVTLNVIAPANVAPDAMNDSFSGKEDNPLVIAVSELIKNDTDPENNTLTVLSVQSSVNGTATLDSTTGLVTFTPALHYAGPASFTYTISDGKGGFDTATVNLDVVPTPPPPPPPPKNLEVASTSFNVSEEGLTGGLKDALGDPDTTDASSIEGDLQIANAAGGLTITLSQPAEVLTSAGVAVTWHGDGSQLLTAMAGANAVATVSVDNTGHYSFQLLGPIDHNSGNVEGVKSIHLGVNVSDGVSVATAQLTVGVEDDAPIAVNKDDSFAMIDTNLLITLDTSNSMNEPSGVNPGESRLLSAVKSIERLMDIYDGFGNVHVRLVTFSNNATTLGTEWVTLDAAKAILDNVVTSGGKTNYDGAIANAMSAFADPGKIDGGQNISYFFSDGRPNVSDGDDTALSNLGSAPSGDNGIQLAEEATWKDFLKDNQIKSFAIGMGEGLTDVTLLDPIAYDGQAQQDINGVVVLQMGALDTVLASTVNAFPGQLLSGGLLGSNSGVGADGGYVKSITVEGVTYTYDAATDSVTNSSNGLMHFDTSTKNLTVDLGSGGQFVVDMDDGTYQYRAPNAVSSALVEHFDFVIVDKDGSQASATVNFDVEKANVTVGLTSDDVLTGLAGPDVMLGREGNDTITGNGGKDTILGGDGDDLISGGSGDDRLSGGLGADTFVWSLADAGVKGHSSNDIISDFDVTSSPLGGDTLDLRDLLVGENHATGIGNLADFLHFEKAGSDTIVHVSSTGEFVAGFNQASDVQTITLLNADLLSGLSNDHAVIQDLLTKNKLVVD